MQATSSSTDPKVSLRSLLFRSGEAKRVLGLGIAIAVAGALVAHALVRRREQVEFSHRAASLIARIEESLVAPLEALKALDAFTQAVSEPSAVAFARFADTFLSRYPSLAALEWAQVVRADERDAFEAKYSRELGRAFEIRAPDATGKMVRSPARDRYAVLTRMAPAIGGLEGLDVAFEPVRARFLDDASRRRGTTASAKFQLVEDPPGMYSVAVYEPQFVGSPNEVPVGSTPLAVKSLAIALYRISPLLRRVLDGAAAEVPRGGALRRDEQLTLIDEDPSLAPRDRVVFSTTATTTTRGLDYTRTIAFAGRRWLAVVTAPRRSHVLVSLGMLVVGMLLAMAVSTAVAAARASAELRRKNRALESLGQYKLVRLIATGGMGHVYEAQHTLLRRRTAVKVIAAQNVSAETRELFDQEAKVTSELTHDNTITVFDYGHSAEGEFYLAMEYVVGLSLDAIVQRFGPVSPARAKHVLVQVCGSLAEAHALGVVHRDIKPANIMVGPRAGAYDHVKVLDFGLAKTKRSRADHVVGTPRYMPPEAFATPDALTPSADIYSLGCVAFFLLTGRDVFEHAAYDAIVEAQLSQPPPTVRSCGVELPVEFDRIIEKCLEKDPDQRFRSVRHLAAALASLSLGEWTAADAGRWWADVDLTASPVEGSPLRKTIQVRAT